MKLRVASPTLLDRVVGYLSPSAGLTRMRDRAMLSSFTAAGGYKGGKRDRRATRNWVPGGNSADADLLPEFDDLRARSRDLARNLPIATGAVATMRTHVVGDGLVLSAQCGRKILGLSKEEADRFNRQAEWEFSLWAQTADFTRVQCFAEMQALMFGSALESGDVFAIRRYRRDPGDVYGTKIQVVEGDRVSNPNRTADTETLVAGIEHAAGGWPVAIHVADRHPGDLRAKAISWRRVPVRYNDGRRIVVHLFDRLRPGQTRGIPWFAPVIESFKSLGDYTDAEVRAAVVSAMFTVFVKNSADADSSPLPTSDTSSGKDEIELGSGAVIDLAAGESIETANPGRPNPQFDAFVTAFLRQVGVALELPFELLIKHFTASYSASRAALEMAYHSFRRRRTWLSRNLCAVAYEWFMEEAILLGRLDAPGFFNDPLRRAAWLNAEWTGPVRISLDPKKDAEADEIDRRNGFKTSQQVMTERTGGDFEDKTETIERENAARKSAGVDEASPTAGQSGGPSSMQEPDPEDDRENA